MSSTHFGIGLWSQLPDKKGFYILQDKNSNFWKYEAQRFSKAPYVGSLSARKKFSWRYTFQGMARAQVYT